VAETKTKAKSEGEIVLVLPVLPTRGTVLYPRLAMPMAVGRSTSVEAVKAALATEDKSLVLVAQHDPTLEDPAPADLFEVGTLAVVKQMARADGVLRLLLVGSRRVRIERFDQSEPYRRAHVRTLPEPQDSGPEIEARRRTAVELARRVLELLQPEAAEHVTGVLEQATDALQLAYTIANLLPLDVARAQAMLEAETRLAALDLLNEYLVQEVRVLEIRREIGGKTATEMDKTQREYLLRQQLRAIQDELGEGEGDPSDLAPLRERLERAELPEPVRKEAEREMDRLARLPSQAPDHAMTRSYLEMILDLPWSDPEPEAIDLARARTVLDEDHYDVEEIKDRILDHLAVMKLNPEAHAPILCFVGPPGVGKTSLGQSIARALGRKFERLSLGGLHDEGELRGHRRTYIGAMPGRILQALRRAGTKNTVLMLDEVDKLDRGFHGDPSSALLEILDPAQNGTFRDNYLDLPFDLSRVFFITTANTLDTIPAPLLDRMEVLRLSGYTPEEKVAIARRYLIPRQVEQAGLNAADVPIGDDVLQRIIARYTREAGVRELERQLGRLCRKIARSKAEGRSAPAAIAPEDLLELLGEERLSPEEARKQLPPGVATGLAWTESGGDVLYVEVSLIPENNELRMTGSLGEIMRESAIAARTWVWGHARQLGFDPALLHGSGVHFHVPAGAVPKDGPSAGVALATALASACLDTPTRADTAMTGEISLVGLVLPVGGIKEKVLAAHRLGLRRVLLPRANERDLKKVPESARSEMEFVMVERLEEALAAALTARVAP
jgi:ATP-dependent Lon protease